MVPSFEIKHSPPSEKEPYISHTLLACVTPGPCALSVLVKAWISGELEIGTAVLYAGGRGRIYESFEEVDQYWVEDQDSTRRKMPHAKASICLRIVVMLPCWF